MTSRGAPELPPPPLDPALAAKAPYGQPLADPGRTGLAQRPLRLPLSRTVEVALEPSATEDRLHWLVARAQSPALVATSSSGFWVIDLGDQPLRVEHRRSHRVVFSWLLRNK